MRSFRSALGMLWAISSVVGVVAIPFGLTRAISHAIAATGVAVDPSYTGGAIRHVSDRSGYRIEVHERVVPTGILSRKSEFVQVGWSPIERLGRHVSDEIDLDHDGQSDVVVAFDLPADPHVPLLAHIEALHPEARRDLTQEALALKAQRAPTQSAMDRPAFRVGDGVVVRIPGSAIAHATTNHRSGESP